MTPSSGELYGHQPPYCCPQASKNYSNPTILPGDNEWITGVSQMCNFSRGVIPRESKPELQPRLWKVARVVAKTLELFFSCSLSFFHILSPCQPSLSVSLSYLILAVPTRSRVPRFLQPMSTCMGLLCSLLSNYWESNITNF